MKFNSLVAFQCYISYYFQNVHRDRNVWNNNMSDIVLYCCQIFLTLLYSNCVMIVFVHKTHLTICINGLLQKISIAKYSIDLINV